MFGKSSASTSAGAPARDSERKLVTVLFTDIVGSTALAEQLDPEEWADIVSGVHELVSAAITRFGGHVAQLLGDGALAFFGAPEAHEDDPERASFAALEIIARMEDYSAQLRKAGRLPGLHMRVGLNSGLVMVGNIGAGAHVEYLAVGDTVNLAARMQSAAGQDTVCAAESTARAVRHAFELESLGPLTVKGKSEPVSTFRILRAKDVVDSKRGIVGLDSPIVGRDAEIARLQERLQTLANGTGGMLSVTGEAGLGKSRLVREVLQRSTLAFRRSEGRCVSFQQSTPYALISDLLIRHFGLRAADDAAVSAARVREACGPHAAEWYPLIVSLLELPLDEDASARVRFLDPPVLRERTLAALAAYFEQEALAGPLALVFEDIHWADSASLDALERLMPVAARAPLLLVGVYRPGEHEPSWRYHLAAAKFGPDGYATIPLKPLDAGASRQLVANLLHVEDLPPAVRARILAKSEGNPFFVEEVIRSLLDSGLVIRDGDHWRATRDIVQIALPDTLAGVITARLDRLPDEHKRVAQTAAVLGREFGYDLLRAVGGGLALDSALAELEQRELIVAKRGAATLTYQFKHVLTQEAAYGSLLLSRRRTLHKQTAEHLEQIDRSRVAEIGWHFIEAQEPLRGLPYLVEAAERLARAYATADAIEQFERALVIVKTSDDIPLARRVYEGLGGALQLANDPVRALSTYAAMQDDALARGDPSMRISALNKMAMVSSMWLGQFEDAAVCLLQSEALSREHNDRAGLAEKKVVSCNILISTADFDGAVEHLGELVTLGQELDRPFEVGFGLVHSANAWTYLVRFDQTADLIPRAREYLASSGDLVHESELLAFSSPFLELSRGNLAAARQSSEDAIATGRRVGAMFGLLNGLLTAGYTAHLQGDLPSASEYLSASTDLARQIGLPFFVAMCLGAGGNVLLDMDPPQTERALAMHQEAMTLLDHPMGAIGGGMAWADIGECVFRAGQPDTARSLFEKGLQVRSPMMKLMRPRFNAGLARVALVQGDLAAAAQQAAEARAQVYERGMQWLKPMVLQVEGEVAAARGERDTARELFGEAAGLADEMGMAPAARAARAALQTAG